MKYIMLLMSKNIQYMRGIFIIWQLIVQTRFRFHQILIHFWSF